MLSKKLEQFLETQKARMLALDEAEGVNQDPGSPKFYDERTKKVISGRGMLYENAVSWLRSREAFGALGEEFQYLEGVLQEDTLATSAPTWTTKMLPLIRRLYSKLFAQDLVSIQPMTGPSSYIYYLDKTFSTTTVEVTSGDRVDEQKPKDYASSSEQAAIIRELQMKLRRKLVESSTYKLKTDWTLEAEQDWRLGERALLGEIPIEHSPNSGKSLLWRIWKTQRDNPEPSPIYGEGVETLRGAPFTGEEKVQTTNLIGGESRSW